jgi:hypothetical protein
MTVDKLLFALAGLAEKAVTRLAAACLPWSSRSQHESYLTGYRDGLRDAATRRKMGLPS